MDSQDYNMTNVQTPVQTPVLTAYPCLKFAVVDVYQRAVNALYHTDIVNPTAYDKHQIMKPFRDEIDICFKNISFGEASELDMKYFDINDTSFWCNSYDYPIEGSLINIEDSTFRVSQVGLLTFEMTPVCKYCFN